MATLSFKADKKVLWNDLTQTYSYMSTQLCPTCRKIAMQGIHSKPLSFLISGHFVVGQVLDLRRAPPPEISARSAQRGWEPRADEASAPLKTK